MTSLIDASFLILITSFLLIGTVLFLYPALLAVASKLRKPTPHLAEGPLKKPRISMIVVVRNGRELIAKKLQNAAQFDYPQGLFDTLIYSDASTDGIEELPELASDTVRFFGSHDHRGKNHWLNAAANAATGEILLFSDADATLPPKTLMRVAELFADPAVGGVCGERVIGEAKGAMQEGQQNYIKFDSWIKLTESRLGSITSNDGKLYAIRAELFQPILLTATDDAYVGYSVVLQGKRMIFDRELPVYISTPSRNPEHELIRRRRVINQSLSGLLSRPQLFNPLSFGLFSVGLFINKVLRRLLPFFIIAFTASSAILSATYPLLLPLPVGLFLSFIAGYLYYRNYPRWHQKITLPKILDSAFYFLLGNYGMMMGIIDYIRGVRIAGKWNPKKG